MKYNSEGKWLSHMKSRKIIAGLIAGVALFALASCSSASASTQSSSSSSTNAKTPLVLYAAEGYDAAMAKAFTAKTGIPVKVDDDSTGPLLTKITAEKNNPKWSLFWADGNTGFASLDKEGLLLSYKPTVNYTAAGKALLPSDNSYFPTGTTIMAALIYNSAKVTNVPKSYQDLTTAAYQGKIGMNDPSQSGPTYPFIAGMMNQLGGQSNGVAAGKKYFSKLKANGLHVYPTNGDTLHALETGQIDYGMIQSSAAIGETLKVKATANYKPKIVYLSKSTLLPGCIAIDKGASSTVQKEAEQFVNYALSPEGQAVMQKADPSGDSLYWPVVNGVKPLSALAAMPASYQSLDPNFWGPLEGQVNSWFDSNIK